MSGSLSNHLINSHYPDSPFNTSIVSHGPMAFNPMMHGTPYAQQSFSLFNSPSYANDTISEETAKKIATLQVKLDQKLGPEYISQRPGPGGGPKLTYVEGWKIINLANEVFGFNGWSSSLVNLTTDFADYSEETRRYSVGVTAIMRVTLRDGVFHEDTGYGMLENSKSKGAALDKCKKEAVTDGLKRALRNFGNVLGNCLYDKSYTSEVVKMKVEPAKFKKDELHRRPEFDDVKPNISTSSTAASTSAGPSNFTMNRPFQNQVSVVTPTRPPYQQNQTKPLTSVPAHMRSGLNATTLASESASALTTSTNQADNSKGKAPPNPLQRVTTAITTPEQRYNAHHQQQQQQQNNERRVSFSETNKPSAAAASAQAAKPLGAPKAAVKPEPDLNDDDSFDFGSEDDALFAMADLGPPIGANDVDLGRPIESDTETGRPIDQEEGLLESVQQVEDDSAVFAVHPAARAVGGLDSGSGSGAGTGACARSAGAKHPSSVGNSSRSRQELIEAALRENGGAPTSGQSSSTTGQGLAAGTSSTKPNPSGSSSTSGTSLSSSSSSVAQMPPPAMAPQNRSRSSSISQQNHQRYMNQKQQQNQNQNQNQNTTSSTSTSTSTPASGQQPPERASTLAIGGFKFPNGVNPTSLTVKYQSGGSGIGVKRPIEATGGSNYRGARPGMGLHQVPTTGAAASPNTTTTTTANGMRSVLGSLDIEEGGAVKRPRQW